MMTKLTVHVVLDRSGSMQIVKNDTIGAFNQYVEKLAEDHPDSTLSLTIFDNQSIDTIFDNRDIGDVPPLDASTYVPRGGTPLYDAIGFGVSALDDEPGSAKALVILTDGHENASREYTKEAIKALLDEKQDKEGWLVIYLGANQDAWETGSQFGTQSGNTMTYDTRNMAQTFAVAAASTARYASAGGGAEGRLRASFTAEERKKAKGEVA